MSGATTLPQAFISVLTWCQLALYTVTLRTFWNTSMHSDSVAAGKKSFMTSWRATMLKSEELWWVYAVLLMHRTPFPSITIFRTL